ncbi:PrsW family glutamic-type intramembrane protease [Streptomyces sp. WMMB 322]|uniref:PrsW family glutamic-type intramembrane protease n=1 Tax=Streptomyces sp. WMMB 322 TaxID=1286821 RepID=UPI000823C4EF|nr:PrsW family glutamic-type intramembrane protease [Streptomyces sp. WMMB 322]SCK09598.1 Protease prsW family protein [Streptomyces sp. WMMB 322]
MTGPRSLSIPDDPLLRARALLIARIAIGVYLVELLLNLTRPHLLPDEPPLSIFYKLPGSSGSLSRFLAMPEIVFWVVLAGILAGAAVQIFAAVKNRAGGSDSAQRAIMLTWITLGCLLLPFALIPLTVVIQYLPVALLCLPSTAIVLLLLRAAVRFSRMSWSALLAAFAWGALIVFGLSRAYSSLGFGTLWGYTGPAAGTQLGSFNNGLSHTIEFMIMHLSVFNALSIGAGVVLLLTLLRHRITDSVTGLVLGAAIGLGYNFVENVLIIKVYGSIGTFLGPTGGFEYWIRQSIGLLGGQVTFGALLGAGLAAARSARRRKFIVTASLIAAIGGSTGAETLSGWLAGQARDHVDIGSTLDTLVISPFFWLLPQLPFTALAAGLLVTGLCSRAPVLRKAVAAEATESAAISQAETKILASPVLRFWALVSTWRAYGRPTARALHQLQSAQLELAAWRAQNHPAAAAEGDELRARVMRMKDEHRAVNS